MPIRRRRAHARWITAIATVTLLVAGLLGASTTSASAANNAHITGKVTNGAGVGIAGVETMAFKLFDDDGEEFWEAVRDTGSFTKADGTYSFDGLGPGTYRMGYHDPNGGFITEYYNNSATVEDAKDIAVAMGGTTPDINVKLAKAGHIAGTVTKAGGAPLADMYVVAYSEADEGEEGEPNYGITDEDGHYDVGGLTAGSYVLDFEDYSENPVYASEFYDNKPDFGSATKVAVAAGATVPGKDAELAKGGRIKGHVTGPDGQPASDIAVTAYLQGSDDDSDGFGIYTNSAGNYTVSGLAAGTYRIGFDDEGGQFVDEYYNDKPTVEEADDIVVTSATTVTGKDAQLSEGSHITGKVTKSGGTGLGSVAIDVYQQIDEGSDSFWEPVQWSETENDGTYDVGGLAAGTYRLGFTDENGVLVSEYYDNKSSVEEATDIVVGADSTVTGKDAELGAGAHITGKVTKSGTTTGIGDVDVEVLKPVTIGGETYWDYAGDAFTNANGTYNVGGLPTGTYRVGFFDYEEVYATMFYDNVFSIDTAKPVAVTGTGTTSNINAAMVKGGKIAGKVTFPAGVGGDDEAARSVQAVDIATGEAVGGAWIDAESGNKYSISGLPAGSYRVEFARASGLTTAAAQFYNGKQESAGTVAATPVVVAGGDVKTNINATLAKGGTISGTVVDGGGDPVADCGVYAFTSDDSYATRAGVTDDQGDFSVTGLTGGSYKLVVGGPGECDGHKRFYTGANGVLSSDEGAATPIAATLGGTVTLTNNLVDADPSAITNASMPTISGTASVGSTLTADKGSWIAPAGTVYSYAWLADGTTIVGATAKTYKPASADVGKKISVTVTGSKAGLEDASATSVETGVVTGNVTTTARITVDASGKSTINVACVKACVGYLQVWSDAGGTKKSDVVKYSVAAKSYKSYALTNVPKEATTGAKVRLAQSSPNAGVVQFNNLEIVKAVPPVNTLKTTPKVTVSSAGKATVNLSCTMACEGYVQLWSDGEGTKKSTNVFHYKLTKAGYVPMPFTGLTYENSTAWKTRVAIKAPATTITPLFNALELIKG